ncbi:uncharacterized protein BP01DRAFT_353662 [Aspergillus saccharolyticus JOP 1030-1]|uniref:Uncharacterized protein n=1 Tax=Aspergillus saccharolyticus JOP 1030-1 TaxID=1450539 RepID=A0A318ZPP0_9EURO|nr:hypothetical protein BP01DRAFT_353662 [Aspergillus saccharolyticus JOP 1030-1]PYH48504.1 hypothetical protein BP01DRAFT_353662 [Aspergillus saccharolyticus JOP 1030-1]
MGFCGLTPEYESWVESRNGRLRSLRRRQDPAATRILLPPGYVIQSVREAEDSPSYRSFPQEQDGSSQRKSNSPRLVCTDLPAVSPAAGAKTGLRINVQRSSQPNERRQKPMPKAQRDSPLRAPRILTLERLPNGLYKLRTPFHSLESSFIDLRSPKKVWPPAPPPSLRDWNTWETDSQSFHGNPPSSKISRLGTHVQSPFRGRFYRTSRDDNGRDDGTVNGRVSSWVLQNDEYW